MTNNEQLTVGKMTGGAKQLPAVQHDRLKTLWQLMTNTFHHCISGVPSDITSLNKKHGPYVYPSRTTAAVQPVTFAACILSGHIF